MSAARRDDIAAAIGEAIWGHMWEAAAGAAMKDEAYRLADAAIAAIQTDDGAAPGHGLGGSTPAAAAPSSPTGEAAGPAVIGGQPGTASSSTGDGAGTARASQGPAPSSLPRSFQLVRHIDVSGVSGTGVVAEGTQFRDGSAALHWYGDYPSTAVWPSVEYIVAVHGHQGATQLRWLDAPIDLWPAEGGGS